jgi:hypothetical protein
MAGLGSGFNSFLAIHDQIPAAEHVKPGAFPESIIVSVTY